MSPVTEHGLFAAEHRALRELYGTARHVADHWAALAARLGGAEEARLAAGARAARDLLEELATRTEASLREHQQAVMAAVLAQAEDPERAVQPAEDSPLGRAGHRLAAVAGTVGEAVDASVVGRAARRASRRR